MQPELKVCNWVWGLQLHFWGLQMFARRPRAFGVCSCSWSLQGVCKARSGRTHCFRSLHLQFLQRVCNALRARAGLCTRLCRLHAHPPAPCTCTPPLHRVRRLCTWLRLLHVGWAGFAKRVRSGRAVCSCPRVLLRAKGLHGVARRCTALHCFARRCTGLRGVARRCSALHGVARRCTALHGVARRCTAVRCGCKASPSICGAAEAPRRLLWALMDRGAICKRLRAAQQ